jgi:NAD(P)-dependent dehydrogenase (short-subunit alcohol dehydrogenase family)
MIGVYAKRLGFLNELNGAAYLAAIVWLTLTGGLMHWLQACAVGLAFGVLYRFVICAYTSRVAPLPGAAVLITGTSTGIGAACAVRFACEGFTVFATVRKAADGERTKASAPAGVRDRIVPVILDVADADSVTAAAATVTAEISARGLALQSVVNNAGCSVNLPLEMSTPAHLDEQFHTNVYGVLAVTNAFLPLLRAARGHTSVPPSVLFVSSAGGKVTFPTGALYTASKHALEAIGEGYRYELAPMGIRSVIIEPGATDTPILSRVAVRSAAAFAQAAEASGVEPDVLTYYRSLTAQTCEAFVNMLFKVPPAFVADTVVEAATHAAPHLRYRATPDAHMIVAGAALFPDVVLDTFNRLRFTLKAAKAVF